MLFWMAKWTSSGNRPGSTPSYPGGVFGEMALLNQLPRTASAIAKTDCRVAVITAQRFTRLVSQSPYFALDMMRLLAERLRRNLES